jgi:hypothetical protein
MLLCQNGPLREDGRLVHEMYLAQVKTPAESKGPWDFKVGLLQDLSVQAIRRSGHSSAAVVRVPHGGADKPNIAQYFATTSLPNR